LLLATVLLARRFFTSRRAERVGPAAFLLRRGDEKNLSATGISVRLLQVFCDAARSQQNKEESLITALSPTTLIVLLLLLCLVFIKTVRMAQFESI